MLSLLFLVGLFACSSAEYVVRNYYYHGAVTGTAGNSFSSMSDDGRGGRIVGVRVWQLPGNYITGMQLKYKDKDEWAVLMGRRNGNEQELNLFEDEVIFQISGQYIMNGYICQVIFVTSLGRSLIVGSQNQTSFNFHPPVRGAELILLSGSYNGQGITSLGAHWAELVKLSEYKQI